jgi:hypothetical protein
MHRTQILTALAAAGAIAATAGPLPAHAETAPPDLLRTTIVGDSVVVTTDTGDHFVRTRDHGIALVDSNGDTVTTIPVSIELNGRRFAVRGAISAGGRSVTFTPDPTASRAVATIASPMEDQLALGQLATDLGNDTGAGLGIGTLVGVLIGAALGAGSCVVAGPTCVVITPAASAAFGAVGGFAGTLVGGAVALAGSGWTYLVTVQSPPGRSPYANQYRALLNSRGAGAPDATPRLPTGSSQGLTTGSGAP